MPGDFSSGARFEIRITPADVGKRVSVRQLVQITDGHPTFTDTIGVLASWDAGVVCVTRRTGETVEIPQAELVAGKVVPPAPVRRGRGVPSVTPEELEAIASRAWPATETRTLGGWTLRASIAGAREALPNKGGGGRRAGFTRRANSVLVGGEPGIPVADALEAVVRWYGERGLEPYLQLPDTSPFVPDLDRLGWVREGDTVVRTAPLAPLTSLPGLPRLSDPGGPPGPGSSDPGGGDGVALSRTPDAAWLAAYHRTGELADAALKVVSGGPSVWFATAPGAIGRAVVDGPWALFGAVEVEPSRRRRGLARAVMGALARRAYDEGATAAYLQVEADNPAARGLYDRLGFTDHHGYHYRRPPRPAA